MNPTKPKFDPEWIKIQFIRELYMMQSDASRGVDRAQLKAFATSRMGQV